MSTQRKLREARLQRNDPLALHNGTLHQEIKAKNMEAFSLSLLREETTHWLPLTTQ